MALKSMSRLTSIFLALFMLLSIGLVYWQIIQPTPLATFTYSPDFCASNNQPVRGRILDRNGVVLATSEYDPKAPCNYRRHYCVPSLSPLLGYFSYLFQSGGLEDVYDNYLTGEAGAGQTTLTNFWDRTLHRSIYGSDIYLTIDWRVQNLIDKQYDITYENPGNNLRGAFFDLPKGSIGMDPTEYATRKGCDPTLASQLYVPPSENAAHYHPGSIVVEDPHTGEILGILSRPYYDAEKLGDYTKVGNITQGKAYFDQISKDALSPLLVRPTQLYLPGSTFKTVTLPAALQSGVYNTRSSFGGNNCLTNDSEALHYVIDGYVIDDFAPRDDYGTKPACPISITEGYVYSDNVIFARVGVGLGNTTWLNYAQRFGVVDSKAATIPPFHLDDNYVIRSSRVDFNAVNNSRTELAQDAYGQGTLQVSPLEMTFVTSTVANNGIALRPHILYKIVPHGSAASSVNPTAPTPYGDNNGQLISSSVASIIRDSMRGVVDHGSAGLAHGTRSNMGGKTGTAQLDGPDPHSWFISMAPDGPGQTPQYVVTVMRENGDEGLLQAPVADCIQLALGAGIDNSPLQNIHNAFNYPSYHCIP